MLSKNMVQKCFFLLQKCHPKLVGIDRKGLDMTGKGYGWCRNGPCFNTYPATLWQSLNNTQNSASKLCFRRERQTKLSPQGSR